MLIQALAQAPLIARAHFNVRAMGSWYYGHGPRESREQDENLIIEKNFAAFNTWGARSLPEENERTTFVSHSGLEDLLPRHRTSLRGFKTLKWALHAWVGVYFY